MGLSGDGSGWRFTGLKHYHWLFPAYRLSRLKESSAVFKAFYIAKDDFGLWVFCQVFNIVLGIELVMRVDNPIGVRPYESHASAAGYLDHLLLEFFSFYVDLGKASGYYHT